MLELFKIAGKIELDGVEQAERGLDKVDKKAGGFGSKLGKVAGTVGKAGLAIGAATAAAGGAAFAMVNKVTQGFDRIAKTAPKLGISTDALQEMEYWAGQNGISSQTLERAVGRLNQRMGLAAEGNEKYSDALTNLGVDMEGVKNGTISTEDAMATSIQTLSQMTNEQEKSALASELFGTKMARDLMPALKDGALTMDQAKAKAEELGFVIGGDSLAAAEKFQDSWDNLTKTFTAVGQKLLADLMPAFQAMMDWVLAHMPQIQAVISTVFDVIGTVFDTLKTAVRAVISTFQEWLTSNETTMNGIWATIQETFGQVVTFLQESWASIRAFWEENGASIMENAMRIFQSIKETVQVNFEAVRSIIEQIIGYVVPFIQEQLARIQEFWAENGEQIMAAVENAFSIIQGVVETVMPIITSVIESAWAIISSAFDAAVGIIMGIVKTFASLLTGDFEGIKEGLTQIWESLWEGIKGIVSGAWSLLSGAFSTLWGEISGWFGGLKDDALDWGANMIDGFIDGIKSMAGSVGKAASNVVQEAGNFIKFWSPAKKGEGRYIRHWGRNMIDGFLDGVRDEEDSAGKAMESVVKRMNPGSVEFDAKANIGGRGIIGTSSVNKSGTAAGHSAGGDGQLADVMRELLYIQQQQLSALLAGQTIEMSAREVARTIYRPIQEFAEKDTINKMRAKGV